MFSDEKWTVGSVIKQERENRGATQLQLCHDLCSITTMNRIENDERDMNVFLQSRILQRLGFTPDKFELFGSSEEQEQYGQRVLIERYMRQSNFDGARQELRHYREKWKKQVEKEPLQRQFVLGVEGYLELQAGNLDQGIEKLRTALKITVPELKTSLYNGMLIGEDELALFNMIACAYDLSGERYKAFNMREDILDYLERSQLRMDQLVKLYAKLVCDRAPIFLEMGRAAECLEQCEHTMEFLSAKSRLFYLQDLLYWRAQCMEQLYHQGKQERETVIESFQKAYLIYDLVKNKKMAEVVWKHLKEVYDRECIR